MKRIDTLYLNITNNCQANCDYCYINYRETNDKFSETLNKLIIAIKQSDPTTVIITGGEPLLYPKLVSDIMNFFKIDHMKFFRAILCSNLLYDKISKEQLYAISKYDELQTTISIERFKDTKSYIHFLKNIKYIKSKLKIKIGLILTISPKFIGTINPIKFKNALIYKYLDWIKPEALSYSEYNLDYERFYIEYDNYLSSIFRFIPKDKNIVLNEMKNNYKFNKSIQCNLCSDSNIVTYINGKFIIGCNCLVKQENRSEKFKTKCCNCSYFKYCNMDCERFGNYCAFPKNTFDKYIIRGEN